MSLAMAGRGARVSCTSTARRHPRCRGGTAEAMAAPCRSRRQSLDARRATRGEGRGYWLGGRERFESLRAVNSHPQRVPFRHPMPRATFTILRWFCKYLHFYRFMPKAGHFYRTPTLWAPAGSDHGGTNHGQGGLPGHCGRGLDTSARCTMAASSADDHLTVGGDADVVVSADLEHLGNVPSTPSAQLGLLTAALSGWC